MPGEDDFDVYFDALKEDIENLAVVISVIQESDYFIVEIESESTFSSLHSSVKDLLAKKYWEKLRAATGFEKVDR
jgi:hypothetical protein